MGNRSNRRVIFRLMISAAVTLVPSQILRAQDSMDRTVLPIPLAPSRAVIDPNGVGKAQDYPSLPTAPKGAPNVILIMTDDEGFGASSAFGGPVPTPHLEQLARGGLRYNQFHTTAMCSPTRAALLTGRNHHAVGMGTLTDFADGYPGYLSIMPKSAATVAEILKDNGYNTAFFGKHHDTPTGQISQAGPFDQWPTGLGFEYFFGFIGADADQWRPALYRGISPVPDDKSGDILDKRLADDAIDWLHNQKAAAPDKPFFIYYAPGSTHFPHQAPADWIARFHGRFDMGWNKLREETLARQKALGLVPRDAKLPAWPADLPQWASLSADERKVQERYMEVYSGMLAYQDEQVGRLIDEVKRMGIADNTMIVWLSGDNGADAASTPAGVISESGEIVNKHTTLADKLSVLDRFGSKTLGVNYSSPWALAMDAPFPYYKQVASHLGGTRNGLVISWPAGIHDHGLRSQYHHVIDIAPTILQAAGVPQPRLVNGVEQQPMDGIAMEYSFDDPKAADRRTTQYYEMMGNRAIYHDGWLANTTPLRETWAMGQGPAANENMTAKYGWELYNLRTDFTQSTNIAARYPEKLKEMQALFETEAAKFHVNPLDDRTGFDRVFSMHKAYVKTRDDYVYWGKNISLPNDAAPAITNRSFAIDADVELKAGATDGVIVADGGHAGGWSFYIKDSRPQATHVLSMLPEDAFVLTAPDALPVGKPVHLRYAFTYAGGGMGKAGELAISVDGKQVATGRIDRTIVLPAEHVETFDIGLDRGVPVTDVFDGDGRFPGRIDKVEVKLGAAGQAGAPPAP